MGLSETTEQRSVIGKLRKARPVLVYTATANGANVSAQERRKLKAEGVVAGVPDLLVFTPPPCGGYVGFFAELKRKDASPSAWKDHQRAYAAQLRQCGWFGGCYWGADAVIAAMRGLGYAI